MPKYIEKPTRKQALKNIRKKTAKKPIPRPTEKDLPPGKIRKAGKKARTYRERMEEAVKRTARPKRRR